MQKNNRFWRYIFYAILAAASVYFIYTSATSRMYQEINIGALYDFINSGIIKKAYVKGTHVFLSALHNSKIGYYMCNVHDETAIVEKLLAAGVKDVTVRNPISSFLSILRNPSFVPLLSDGLWLLRFLGRIIEVFIYFALFNFIRSVGIETLSSTEKEEKVKKVFFKDIVGMGTVWIHIKSVFKTVISRKNKFFSRVNLSLPKGVLLFGPPGNGKTLIATALANEANMEFIGISGSSFVQMYVGVGPARVRELFRKARASKTGAVIFIDEADALASRQDVGSGPGYGGGMEYNNTVNQLLFEIDGCKENEAIFIILATNREEMLDPALTRSGRIDQHIYIGNPVIKERKELLDHYLKRVNLLSTINTSTLASTLYGFSRADIAALINSAVFIATQRAISDLTAEEIEKDGKYLRFKIPRVSFSDMEEAKDRIIMGIAGDKNIMPEWQLRNTSYHECGHAFVSVYLKRKTGAGNDLHKITIIPRGSTLGVAYFREDEKFFTSKEEIEIDIMISLAGRIAEECFFGPEKVTGGCSSDLRAVRRSAEEYVLQGYAGTNFSSVSKRYELISQNDQNRISQEIDNLVSRLTEETRKIVYENKAIIERAAQYLLLVETMSKEDFERIIDGVSWPIVKSIKRVNTFGNVII